MCHGYTVSELPHQIQMTISDNGVGIDPDRLQEIRRNLKETTDPASESGYASIDDVLAFADEHDYPIMIKAALGGGGRGMRVAHDEKEARDGYERAKSEAQR